MIFINFLLISYQPVNAVEKIYRIQERKGLIADGKNFTLGGRPFRILSGSFHYFRVPNEFWKNRLELLKTAGLNTVSIRASIFNLDISKLLIYFLLIYGKKIDLKTYIPWNLHEAYRKTFNFYGDLDLIKFLNTASDVGLYVILRPGPYICAEWDWGGFPYWLLKRVEKIDNNK